MTEGEKQRVFASRIKRVRSSQMTQVLSVSISRVYLLGQQVSVGHIVPGGAADLDSRLNTGDLIMSVEGESVMNSSHHRVVQLMIAAAQNGRVTLGIRRRIAAQEHHHHHNHHHQLRDNVQSSTSSSYSCRPIGHAQYPYEVSF
jgi:C-terminal processing protease CtpA/Prc